MGGVMGEGMGMDKLKERSQLKKLSRVMDHCSAKYVSTEPNDGKCQINLGGAPAFNDDSINVRIGDDNIYNCMEYAKCVESGLNG